MRFPGFEGEWEVKKLGEVSKFSKGKGISKSDIEEEGATECIRYGELYTHYGEVISEVKSRTNVDKATLVLSEQNDVIIPASGETQIDIATASCILRSGIALGGDLNIIKTQNYGVFLAYYLSGNKRQEIANLAQGNSVVHLYSSQLSNLSVNLPKIGEQKKIGSLLTLIDERIQTQSKIIRELETSLKSISHDLFSKKIRFVGTAGKPFPNWQLKKLEQVFLSEKGKGISKSQVVQNGNYKCVLYGELYTKYKEVINEVYSSTDILDGTKSKIGDLLIPCSTTTSGIDLANVTALNKSDILIGGDITILRSRLEVNNVFYAYYLSNYKNDEIASYAQGSTIVHLYYSHFKDMYIDLPCFEEQTRIANFLVLINSKIEVESQLLKKYEKHKEYLLRNLFI